MNKFSVRSTTLELMDYPIEDEQEIVRNFEELVFINKYLGGANLSFNSIKQACKGKEIATIVDIGAGAGDFIDYVLRFESKLKTKVALVAIDLMPEAREFAQYKFHLLDRKVSWITQDFQTWLRSNPKVEIIHASLFCHHLTDEQLVDFFRDSSKAAEVVVINDLHRNFWAYYSILWLTKIFSKSRYTKNDAPLSVLRGFSRTEIVDLLKRAGLNNYEIKWKWAFRFIITIYNR